MKIAIVGSGYVGLVSGVCFAKLGHDVVCVDKDKSRVDAILSGIPPIYEPGLEELMKEVANSGRFAATTDLAMAMNGADVSMIAVGTPATPAGIDLQYIRAAASEIGALIPKLDKHHTVVVKSTVVPTTTQDVVRTEVENASGMKAGEFGLAMNPEFLREGTAVEDFMQPDRVVVGGWDDKSCEAVEALYKGLTCPVLRTNPCNAELIKYTANALLATLVSYSNEITSLCETLPGADEGVVMQGLRLDRRLRADRDGKVGHPEIVSYLRGGIGFGGSCLPKDVIALRQFANNRQLSTPILDSVLKVNRERPVQVIDQLSEAVGGLKDKTIGVLGLAFKADTDDIRESPALRLVDALLEAGAKVTAYDPIAAANAAKRYEGRITITDSPEGAIKGADGALIATSWPQFQKMNWNTLAASMKQPVIFDGRQVIAYDPAQHNFRYLAVGLGPRVAA